MAIQLTTEHDAAIRSHGEEIFPNECCGFVLGRFNGDGRETVELRPVVNAFEDDEKHHRFSIDPRDFMLAEKDARAKGLDIVGFYHSHPDHPARPSQYDIDHAWPVYSYIIVSVLEGKADAMTSWILKEDRSAFNPEPIQIL